jgi:hypothetical protein
MKLKVLIPLVLSITVGIFILGWVFGAKKNNTAHVGAQNALNQEILRQSVVINEQKTYITSIEQENMTQKDAIKRGDIEREELRKLNLKTVNELTKAKLTINILLDSVANNGTVIIIKDTITINNPQKAILLPFQFSEKNKWYDFAGGFDINGKMSAIVNVYGDFSVWTGISKDTKKPIAIITTDNPNIQINSISSVKMDLPKPKLWGVGIQFGWGIALSNPLKGAPYVGVGISRNFIRF